HILSREQTDAPVNHGRIDRQKCEMLSQYLVNIQGMDHIFLCGPEEMIFSTREWLMGNNIPKEKIHFELFTVPGEKIKTKQHQAVSHANETSEITIKIDGVS